VGAFGVVDPEDGADYGKLGLTPNLDRLARESLWFDNAFAGGTRTVRGMEALTLSLPPIPGQSVLRRDGCERLGTLGSALARNGYDTAFIYGGDGFFDNMSYFFSANGYRVVDRPAQEAKGILPSFANAWGACDEDAFAWSVAEADRAHAAGKPFHHFIMTTSNHRPYTWPEGRISPALRGRNGGVAYTDHAIGAFLEAARSRPWFKDTVFVIVADHGASVAGKRELEVAKYHIPMLIWSPAHVAPRRVGHLVAQVDLAPTLLALLGLPHTSTFLGADALSPAYRPRAFISNYQKVGLVRDGVLTVLKPVRKFAQYEVDLRTGALRPLEVPRPDLVEATRAYYQGADDLFSHGKLRHDAGPR
jgi:phosphoglycerol transferase MdoB-like AlkP superfamily enzyme